MKRKLLIAGIIISSSLILTGCSNSTNSNDPSLNASNHNTSISLNQEQPSSPVDAGNTLIGIGALDGTWESHHKVDNNFSKGMAYDPTPGYGLDSDHTDLFYSVDHTDGVVTGFAMNLPGGTTTLKIAYDLASKQLPSDSKLLWRGDKGTCYAAEYYSPLLNKFLGSKANGGVLFVFYDGLVDISAPFNPKSINVSNVMVLDKKYNSLINSPSC